MQKNEKQYDMSPTIPPNTTVLTIPTTTNKVIKISQTVEEQQTNTHRNYIHKSE